MVVDLYDGAIAQAQADPLVALDQFGRGLRGGVKEDILDARPNGAPVGHVDVLQDEAFARLLLDDVSQLVHAVLDETRADSVSWPHRECDIPPRDRRSSN